MSGAGEAGGGAAGGAAGQAAGGAEGAAGGAAGGAGVGAAGGVAGGLRRSFLKGERIFMEQSRKFDEARIHAFAAEAGMAPSRSWSDDMYLLVELRPPAAAR